MTQRRIVLGVLAFAAVVGAAFFLLDGRERSGVRGPSGILVEPTAGGATGALDATVDRPAIDESEARRALGSSLDDGARNGAPSDGASSRNTPSDVAPLTGRIVDELGQPIAGAAVRTADVLTSFALHDPTGIDVHDDKIGVASTDADGIFRLERAVGPACASIRAAGFAPLTVPGLTVAPGGTTLDDDIVLERSAIVTGVVLSETGEPLENALVVVVDDDGMFRSRLPSGPRTKADGAFRLDVLERRTITLFATHVDHAPQQIEIDARLPVELPLVTIRLPRGEAIEGRLEGFPPSAQTSWKVVARQWTTSNLALRSEARSAAVDESGLFRLGALAAGESWQIYAQPASSASDDSAARVSEALVVASGERDVVLRWEEPATVRFRVVDATTQAPIEWLTIDWGLHRSERQAQHDRLAEYADGFVQLESMRFDREHPPTLTVDAVGYESWSRRELVLESGQQLDLGTVELVPAPRMDVLVLDARNDSPVAGARVSWTEQDMTIGAEYAAALAASEGAAHRPWRRRSRGYGVHPDAITDEHGRASFEGRPGYIVELTATAPGFGCAHLTDWKLPDAGVAEHVLRLEQGGGVDVLARDANGRPLVGHPIEHRLFGLTWPRRKDHVRRGSNDPDRLVRITNAEGRARFEDLPQGGHEFRIGERSDRGVIHWPPGQVQQPEGGWTAVGVDANQVSELVLTTAPRGVLFGRITEHGRPLARARMGLFSKSFPAAMAPHFFETNARALSTDVRGRYRIENIEPGDYVLRIQPVDSSSMFDVDVTVPARELQRDVEFETGVITGRVVDRDGKAVVGVKVSIRVSQQGDASRDQPPFAHSARHIERGFSVVGSGEVRTDANGGWEIRGIEPGVELVALAGGGDSHWQPVCSEVLTLKSAQRLDGVVLVVQPAGALVVKFPQEKDGELYGSIDLTRVVDGETEHTHESLSGITSRVDALAPGSWTLRVEIYSHDKHTEAREIEIVVGETTEVELVVPE